MTSTGFSFPVAFWIAGFRVDHEQKREKRAYIEEPSIHPGEASMAL